MITSVMSSLYEMELENIKERTTVGRAVYVQNGGKLGRPQKSNETDNDFLNKEKSKQIIKSLKKGLTIREIGKVCNASTKTVMKVKALYLQPY
jgi:DNA invertase Pin-like site-specific DNA recombinase